MPSAAINKRGAFLNWRFAVKGIQNDSRSDAVVFGINSSFPHRNETRREGKHPGDRYKLQLSGSLQDGSAKWRVRFTPEAGQTKVELEHRHFEESGERLRTAVE